jgi:hypothetical protein
VGHIEADGPIIIKSPLQVFLNGLDGGSGSHIRLMRAVAGLEIKLCDVVLSIKLRSKTGRVSDILVSCRKASRWITICLGESPMNLTSEKIQLAAAIVGCREEVQRRPGTYPAAQRRRCGLIRMTHTHSQPEP